MGLFSFIGRIAGADGAMSSEVNLSKVGGRLGFQLDDDLEQTWTDQIGQYVEIPQNINADDVEAITTEASYLEGVSELAQAYSQQAQRAARAASAIHGTVARHRQGMMNVNQRVMATNARYLKAASKYQMGARMQRAEVSGYQAAYENASQTVNF